MTQHTAGPWHVSKPPRFVTATDGEVVADIAANHPIRVAANARLIAAAPELLEAVQDLVELRDHPSRYSVGDANKRYERARAAIAKAAGAAKAEAAP